ncbi:acetolactate decarboxylase [Actinomyces vulturis]|uniref:acetolactate decarboxylase n=1 Tax=Actinomyces vulturis TaxID=1857645 RepID=UPI00083563FD|nr:acetolactate decarboxylase [Actinomyces vulturis]
MPQARHTIYQSSLISALAQGIYEDDMTIGELMSHGSFGIGTFNGLDGEMIILDGVCYQLRGNGSVSQPSSDHRTPYAVVTHFVPRLSFVVDKPMSRSEFAERMDELLPSANYMYALKITGLFQRMSTRTVVKQDKPYRPMIEATHNEPIFQRRMIDGTVVAFRTPIYEQNISVAGCHAHFLADSHDFGGHIMDFDIMQGRVEVCPATDFHVRLPMNDAFEQADFTQDASQDIAKVEHQPH